MVSGFTVRIIGMLIVIGLVGPIKAEQATIAVASNFTGAMKQLQSLFQQQSSHKVKVSFGSSGKLYAQILHGAPFDAFLSADVARPEKLLQNGHAMAATDFIYANGVLVLWSHNPQLVNSGGDILGKGFNGKLAIANPKTAPYGMAAIQTLESLGLASSLKSQLVIAENISQAYQFVATGNAALGLIALSQIKAIPTDSGGSFWCVPASHYQPIKQKAVLLEHGRNNAAAQAFLTFLQSPEAVAIIETLGYRVLDTQKERTPE